MLTLSQISKAYGPKTLFEEITLNLQAEDRLGLVGPNGAGKSTLFRIILGEEEPDAGEVTWVRGARYGFLPQEGAAVGNETILEIAVGIHAVEAAGAHADLSEIDYAYEAKAKRILAGLSFKEADFEAPARTFSGGWVMRAHLARLLVDEPDLLLLDEPTNHLDLETLIWVQEYLKRYRGGLVVISHDRAFLNALCTGMLELRPPRLYRWSGNYDDYVGQSAAHAAQQEAAYKNQQREIAHLQRFVDRFGAKASLATRAKSKEKQIARLEARAVEAPEGPTARIHFSFPQPGRSGHKVMDLKGVRQAYGDKVVYRDLNFEVERGKRLVLVGPNGAGKSTLLKILGGVIPIQAGERLPGHNVEVGYFSQNRVDTLEPKNTVLAEALAARSRNADLHEQLARNVLGSFLFSGEAVDKPVGVLSGGEKTRLALVKLLLAPPNLLLMDEPTTHLDIASIDALIGALQAFEGTLVFISHDVHFIRSIAEQVLHVDAGRLTPYAGDYDYFLEKSRNTDARTGLTAAISDHRPGVQSTSEKTSTSGGSGYRTKEQKRAEAAARAAKATLAREVEQLEQRVAELEAKQAELTSALADSETYTNESKARQLQAELEDTATALKAAEAEWESKAAELEGAVS